MFSLYLSGSQWFEEFPVPDYHHFRFYLTVIIYAFPYHFRFLGIYPEAGLPTRTGQAFTGPFSVFWIFRPCLVQKKNLQIFLISRHIKSLDACIEH